LKSISHRFTFSAIDLIKGLLISTLTRWFMGKLFEMRQKIDAVIKVKKLDEWSTRGQVGMKAGILIGGITDKTPDDPEKIRKLKQAAKECLGIDL
jgi:hypothetical protein